MTSLHDHHDNLVYSNLSYLCSFFKYLVRTAPCGAVFCIIDNVRSLERAVGVEVMDIIVDMLRDLVTPDEQDDQAIAFKPILFTPDLKGVVLRGMQMDEVVRVRAIGSSGGTMTPKQTSRRLRSCDSGYSESLAPGTSSDDVNVGFARSPDDPSQF